MIRFGIGILAVLFATTVASAQNNIVVERQVGGRVQVIGQQAVAAPVKAQILGRWLDDPGHVVDAVMVRNQLMLKTADVPAEGVVIVEHGDTTYIMKAADAERHNQEMVGINLPRGRLMNAKAHTFTDALGNPIAGATVTIQVQDRHPDPTLRAQLPAVETDGEGKAKLPQFRSSMDTHLMFVTHQDIGTFVGLRLPRRPEQTTRLPIVSPDSPGRSRAVQGRVVDAAGEPVSQAWVQTTEVRTPGEGLLQNHGLRFAAVTDADGQFTMYEPDKDLRDQRGKLIPPGSRYYLTVNKPDDPLLFPARVQLLNHEPGVVVLEEGRGFHRFVVPDLDGKPIEDEAVLTQVTLTFMREAPADRVILPTQLLTLGGGLLPGTYSASLASPNGQRLNYLPLVVTADSPDVLAFELPPSLTYHGRVIDQSTGEPLPGAYVIGMAGVAGGNTAWLTQSDWDALDELSTSDGAVAEDHPAVAPVRKQFSFQWLTRTDEQGRYQLPKGPAEKVYSVLAFAEDFVPVSFRVLEREADDEQVVNVPELPLLPGAKVMVTMHRTADEKQRAPSVSPKWRPAADAPDYVRQLNHWGRTESKQLEARYPHWLRGHEPQPIWVPAGANVKLQFQTPYDRQWVPRYEDRTFHLKQGEVSEPIEVSFDPAVRVAVRVVDAAGKPVEGAAVRPRIGKGGWQIAHNTDANGEAFFHVPPNTTKVFGVDLTDRGMDRPIVEYHVGESFDADDTPVIQLTAEELAVARGPK